MPDFLKSQPVKVAHSQPVPLATRDNSTVGHNPGIDPPNVAGYHVNGLLVIEALFRSRLRQPAQ